MEGTKLKLFYQLHGMENNDLVFKVIAYRDYFDDEGYYGSEILEEEYSLKYLKGLGIKINNVEGEIDEGDQVLSLLYQYFKTRKKLREIALETIPEYKKYARQVKVKAALGM